MPTTQLSKSDFDTHLNALVRLKTEVADLLRPVAAKYLEFAQQYWQCYTSVKGDPRLVQRLRSTLGISEDHHHQRLRRIAEQSKALLPFKKALPAAVEPLYEVALVSAQQGGTKRLREAVRRRDLTPQSGIREIRAFKKAKRSARKKAIGSVPETVVRLDISRSDEKRLAQAVAALLESDPSVTVRSDSQSLVEATKAALAERYDGQTTDKSTPTEPDQTWNVASAFRQLDQGEKVSGTRADDVTKNTKHPFHSASIPNTTLAAKLKAHAERQRWLVPELSLTREHYAPELAARQRRITRR